MTDRPDRHGDPQEIVKWSWAKLRWQKLREQDTTEADRMHREADSANEITERNHFGDGIEKAMRRWAAGT